jgi:hypothetical protein
LKPSLRIKLIILIEKTKYFLPPPTQFKAMFNTTRAFLRRGSACSEFSGPSARASRPFRNLQMPKSKVYNKKAKRYSPNTFHVRFSKLYMFLDKRTIIFDMDETLVRVERKKS